MSHPVRIPADVDRPDRVLGPLTARQLAVLGVTGLLLYALYNATRAFLPLLLFLLIAVPIALAVTVIALGRRDGVGLDRLLLAAVRQRLTPRHQVSAPEGVHPAPAWLTAGRDSAPEDVAPVPLELPARGVTSGHAAGVIDLGPDGLAVIASCSTVNFSLRTPAEQEALVAAFARYLHSLTAPVQFLVRAERLDLVPQIDELRGRAGGLPHPALEAAALDHADYLTQLSRQANLLRRQVLLVLREPGRPAVAESVSAALGRLRRKPAAAPIDPAVRQAAEQRLARRLNEATELLAPAGIIVTALDAMAATSVLAAACNPDTFLPPSAALAGADDIVTAATITDLYDDEFEGR
ncbi:PrgI family protein [Amycolatopsis sp. lyj-346]|uniref:PrgI family protein n=1 Tax=Amycolatopsis sp. lyj-346 TaxID=2789289 RepID=UPI00397E104B